MGCLVSTPQDSKKKPSLTMAPLRPPPLDEETVKEVLSSETPKRFASQPLKQGPPFKPFQPLLDVRKRPRGPDNAAPDITTSTSTRSSSDRSSAKRGPKQTKRKPRPEWNAGPGRIMGRPSLKKEQPCTGRRQPTSPSLRKMATRGLMCSYDGGSRAVERRSRSPGGSRSSRIDRMPSKHAVRRLSQSPGRVNRHVEMGKRNDLRRCSNTNGTSENPAVSLECFIFL